MTRAIAIRSAQAATMLALVAVLLAVTVPAAAIAGHGHHSGRHQKGHRRPHRQAVAGPLRDANVRKVRVPAVHGKGGGVDPGDDYPSRWKAPAQDSIIDQWGMYNRECTSFVAWALHSRNGFETPFHLNANRWGPAAAKRGFTVNSNPSVGSIAWSNGGVFGHVAYVVAVKGGNVTVEEYNYLVRGAYDKRVVSASAFNGFIHFKDLPPEPTPPSPSTSEPSSPTASPTNPPPPPTTYAETTGGAANTWTNYTNAGGTQGPTIPSNATVAISCALNGFRVADGNTWWYRIASSPWNDAFYVSADAFYNNGQTSGSLIGTPFVDSAVRGC